jgi:hypothetical protein
MAPMALDELAQHGFVRIDDDPDPRPCPTQRQSSSNPSSMRSGRRIMPAVKMPSSSVEVSGCGVSLRWPSRQASDFDHYSRPMILGAALRNNRGAFVVKSLPGDAVGVFAVAVDQITSIAFDDAISGLPAFEATVKHDDHSRFRIASSIE